MSNSKYKDFLTFLKGKRILILTHNLVDIDGLTSCYALKFFLNEYFNNPHIAIYFSEISKSTQNFMNRFKEKHPKFNFDFEVDIDFSEFDICLIIDTNNINQLHYNNRKVMRLDIPYIFIDHHHYVKSKLKNENLESLNLINDNFSSTAEIILELYEYYNQNIPPPYKSLILAAILTDTGFFKHGNNETIRHASKLLDEDVNFQDIQFLLKKRDDISERIAKIKGMQRVELIREGDYLIGISNVSSFGASVASMLIKIGFDISIVYSKEKDENVIISRAKKNTCLITGLHLGKIFEKLSEYYEGSGGGHDGAASLNFKGNLDTILRKVIDNIKQHLQSKF